MESAKKANRNRTMREQQGHAVDVRKKEYRQKVREEVQHRRHEKQEQREYLEIQRQQEVLKATSIKQMIRNQEKEAEEKKRYMAAEKKAQARQNFESKVMRENKK